MNEPLSERYHTVLTSFFPIVDTCLSCEDIAQITFVIRADPMRFLGDCMGVGVGQECNAVHVSECADSVLCMSHKTTILYITNGMHV